MAELIANVLTPSDGTVASLSAPLAIDASTFTTAAPFPAALRGGQVRVRIDNELIIATTGSDGVVTVASRGAEGTTAATHASGAKVRHVLTKGSLASMIGSETYVWDEDAEVYVITGVPARRFVGAVDPADAGFTLRSGDSWAPTEIEE